MLNTVVFLSVLTDDADIVIKRETDKETKKTQGRRNRRLQEEEDGGKEQKKGLGSIL